jgi:hypothetical protein
MICHPRLKPILFTMAQLEARCDQETDKMLGEYQSDDEDLEAPEFVTRSLFVF